MELPEIFKNPADFKKWTDAFRKSGLKTLKIGEVTLEFTSEALLPESEYKQKKKSKEFEGPKDDSITEAKLIDELIDWSSVQVPPQGAQ